MFGVGGRFPAGTANNGMVHLIAGLPSLQNLERQRFRAGVIAIAAADAAFALVDDITITPDIMLLAYLQALYRTGQDAARAGLAFQLVNNHRFPGAGGGT